MKIMENTKFKMKKIQNYLLNGKVLGTGNFAKVELATHSLIGKKVAIKIVNLKEITQEYIKKNYEREAQIMSHFNHPNIIKFYEALLSGTIYCIVTEYASGGDMLKYLRSKKVLLENEARKFMQELSGALHYIHKQGVLHRDLKLENILLDEFNRVKLVDFGLSNFFDGKTPLKTHCGSPEYAAPELFISESSYSYGIDLWSLGVILYTMVIGCLPFAQAKDKTGTVDERRTTLFNKIKLGLQKEHMTSIKVFSTNFQDLLINLLQPNPNKRITTLDLCRHSWILKDVGPLNYRLVVDPPPTPKSVEEKALVHMNRILSKPVDQLKKEISEKRFGSIAAIYKIAIDAIQANIRKKLNNSVIAKETAKVTLPKVFWRDVEKNKKIGETLRVEDTKRSITKCSENEGPKVIKIPITAKPQPLSAKIVHETVLPGIRKCVNRNEVPNNKIKSFEIKPSKPSPYSSSFQHRMNKSLLKDVPRINLLKESPYIKEKHSKTLDFLKREPVIINVEPPKVSKIPYLTKEATTQNKQKKDKPGQTTFTDLAKSKKSISLIQAPKALTFTSKYVANKTQDKRFTGEAIVNQKADGRRTRQSASKETFVINEMGDYSKPFLLRKQ